MLATGLSLFIDGDVSALAAFGKTQHNIWFYLKYEGFVPHTVQDTPVHG